MNQLKLEQFEQVIELLKTGSFSQAARNLYTSQPNLSYSIKQLEDEFGFPLFLRTNNGVIPTDEAKDLVEHMTIIYREYNILQNYLRKPTKQHRLFLKVAIMNLYRAVPDLALIINKHIDTPINFSFIYYTSYDALIEQVSTSQVDFALIGILSPYEKVVKSKFKNNFIEYHKFSDSPINILVGPKNPLYHNDSPIYLKDIYPYTLISYGDNNDEPFFSLAHATGLDNKMFGRVHVNSSHLFHETIHSTSAIGLVPCTEQSIMENTILKDLRMIKIEDCTINAELGWIKLKRLPLSDIAAELLETLQKLF